ncbi:hypothetical protein [Carboxylicivirga marina]|uniref:hypothetical protein n=1 Tax=Carboxylicivirga marina TaxID=2800988 RepID=UPI0025948335|nr:hypothetical protein [uncultured Carboxylicivirga sp.]
MTLNCEHACAENACHWYKTTNEVYEEIVSTFRKTNYVLQQIPDSVTFGVFLLDTCQEQIVYADKQFVKMNGMDKRILKRTALQRLALAQMHPVDLRRFFVLYRNVGKKGHPPYINCVLRFKHGLEYNSYYFMMMQPELDENVCKNFLIGIQISQSPLRDYTTVEHKEKECYEQLMRALL